MDAAWVRDQLRGLLQEDVYEPGPQGDQDFLEDFELVVREYQLGKERAALEEIRARNRDRIARLGVPEHRVALTWLTGEQEVT